jgi:hydrogenase maturation factor
MRIAAAVKIFELGRPSSGATVRLAGIPQKVFLSMLADYSVDALTEGELKAEAGLA